MGIPALQKGGTGHVLFYTLGYGLATVGAFGVVALVRGRDAEGNVLGEALSLSKWAGIGRTNPWIAGSMLVFLLSFAGIPLTGGFIGKFVVFLGRDQGRRRLACDRWPGGLGDYGVLLLPPRARHVLHRTR